MSDPVNINETPYRTELIKRFGCYANVLENYKLHIDTLFPHRVAAKYHDAVARLTVAIGDMALWARTFDNLPPPDHAAIAAGKVKKGTGKREHKRKHVRTRPLPNTAEQSARSAIAQAALNSLEALPDAAIEPDLNEWLQQAKGAK